MIRTFHLSRRYADHILALDDVTLDVRPGEFVFLTGPSGAGKSTLFKILTAAERPDEGQVIVSGRNLARLSREELPFFRREVGVVFQDFKLLERRSVRENVALTLEVRGVERRATRSRVEHVLDHLGLTGRADQPACTLSGGEQQRVAIGRALVGEPRLLLADEPTGNVDPAVALEIMGLFEAAHRRGTTVLVATHDLALTERFGHRRVELTHGRVLSDDAASGSASA